MRNKDLQNMLKQYPDDLMVYYSGEDDYGDFWGDIDEIIEDYAPNGDKILILNTSTEVAPEILPSVYYRVKMGPFSFQVGMSLTVPSTGQVVGRVVAIDRDEAVIEVNEKDVRCFEMLKNVSIEMNSSVNWSIKEDK